jgi:ribosomal protein S18 acetylase RimI-like enzyme
MQLESFQISVVDITEVELDKLHALSLSVSWPHRAEDWQFMRETGRGIVALDEIGRILGSAMWFPQEDGFATIGMVITSPRLQGHGAGNWLMAHALGELTNYDLGLNATRAAERLYRSLGFRDEAILYQYQGEARAPSLASAPASGGEVRALSAADFAAAVALDRSAYGAGRAALLDKLFPLSCSAGLFRDGKLVAFSLCRPFGRGYVVGPVVAASDEDAVAVTAPHVAARVGGFLRLDTRQKGTAFNSFLENCGMPLFDTVTTMVLGRPWAARQGENGLICYGLVAQAFG